MTEKHEKKRSKHPFFVSKLNPSSRICHLCHTSVTIAFVVIQLTFFTAVTPYAWPITKPVSVRFSISSLFLIFKKQTKLMTINPFVPGPLLTALANPRPSRLPLVVSSGLTVKDSFVC